MTVKLIIIVLAAAAFGWGFSEIVQQSGETIRPETGRYECDPLAGGDCARQFERGNSLQP